MAGRGAALRPIPVAVRPAMRGGQTLTLPADAFESVEATRDAATSTLRSRPPSGVDGRALVVLWTRR